MISGGCRGITALINTPGGTLNAHSYGYDLGGQRKQQVLTAGNNGTSKIAVSPRTR
jgi:hypothetical protein